MTTFGDHGVNEAQRRAGAVFNMAFGLIKLYEYERRISVSTDRYIYGTNTDPMPISLDGFSTKTGDLDFNLLARLHHVTLGDPLTEEIGQALLYKLNHDEYNIFRRLAVVKDKSMF